MAEKNEALESASYVEDILDFTDEKPRARSIEELMQSPMTQRMGSPLIETKCVTFQNGGGRTSLALEATSPQRVQQSPVLRARPVDPLLVDKCMDVIRQGDLLKRFEAYKK